MSKANPNSPLVHDIQTSAYSIPDVFIPEFVRWLRLEHHIEADAQARQKWEEQDPVMTAAKTAADMFKLPFDIEDFTIRPHPSMRHQSSLLLQNSMRASTTLFFSVYWMRLFNLGIGPRVYPILVHCEIVSPDGGKVQYQDQGPGLVPLPIGTLTVTIHLRWHFVFASHYAGHLITAIPQRWPQAKLTRPMPLREEPEITAPQKPKTAPTQNARNQDHLWQEWFDYYHDMRDFGYGLTWDTIAKEINQISGTPYSSRTIRSNHSLMCRRPRCIEKEKKDKVRT